MKPDEARTVYDGTLIDVTVERWGEHEREIVEHPGAVAVVAVDGEGSCARAPASRACAEGLVEIPAGTREPGEDPLDTAKRELREECGLTGGEWRELGAFWTTPGFCREYMHLFSPKASIAGEAEPEDDEDVEIVRWPVGELESTARRARGREDARRGVLYLSSFAVRSRASCGSVSPRRSRPTSTGSR